MNHDFSSELFYSTARSGGKGGQNVNKVETMAEAWWLVDASRFYTTEEKELIKNKLANRINKDGHLLVKSAETRSQLENKEIARRKMLELVHAALVVPKARKKVKPPASLLRKRMELKQRLSDKKAQRRYRPE